MGTAILRGVMTSLSGGPFGVELGLWTSFLIRTTRELRVSHALSGINSEVSREGFEGNEGPDQAVSCFLLRLLRFLREKYVPN